jgi:hypothetical protein
MKALRPGIEDVSPTIGILLGIGIFLLPNV